MIANRGFNTTDRAALAVALCAMLTCTCTAQELLRIGTTKQVFVDGRFIQNARDVELVANKPRLDGEKLLLPEHPWENQFIGAYTSVIQEGDKVHLWYDARSSDGKWSLAYAFSDNFGDTFVKPKLGVIEFKGSKANNLVLDHSLGHHVFRMGPDAPASEKYGLFIHIRSDQADAEAKAKLNCAFVSPDGIHWAPKGDVPFWKVGGDLHLDSQNIVFWDTRLKKYVAFPRLFNGKIGRAVGRCEADTFAGIPNCLNPKIVMARNPGETAQYYTSAAVQYPYATDAYFAFPAMLESESGAVYLGFAASRDGIKWNRFDRKPLIDTGFDQTGKPIPRDKGSIYAGYGLTRKGDEISFYYTTLNCLHVMPPPGTGIITRAKYRLDGFTSVDATEQAGHFTTPVLLFEGDGLEINFDGSKGGWVKVEILDAKGKPLAGHGPNKADRLTGDSVRMPVTWSGKGNSSPLRGRAVKLRFTIKQGKLYAFQVTNSFDSVSLCKSQND